MHRLGREHRRGHPVSAVAAPAMTEQQLLDAILDTCRLLRLRTAHFRPARTAAGWRTAVAGDGKGFPDLVIVGLDQVVYRELKTDRGRPAAEQDVWVAALAAAGADIAIWRPRDWHSGRITADLFALAGRPR
jgi:hypothetical protein